MESHTLPQVRHRTTFDPTNKKHVAMYKEFLVTGKWGMDGCPFKLEFPFVNIPVMIDNKIVRHYLKVS